MRKSRRSSSRIINKKLSTSPTAKAKNMLTSLFFMEKCIQFDSDSFCRCCLASSNNAETIAPLTAESTEIFRTITSVVLRIGEQLKLCKSCKKDLDMANKFRMKCLMADQKLHEVMSDISTAPSDTELELKIEPKDEEDVAMEEDTEPSRIEVAFVDLMQYDTAAEVKKETVESPAAADDDSVRSPTPPSSPEPPAVEEAAVPTKPAKRMEKKLQCTQCFKYLSSTVAFKFHQDSHRSDRYICHQCGKSFKFRTSILEHFRNTRDYPNHTQEGVHLCLRCPKRYHFLKDLTKHMDNFHGVKTLDFKCQVEGCDAAFAQELHLFEHSFSHTPGVYPFNCQDHSIEDCDYKTVNKLSFRKHLRLKHKIMFEERIHGYKMPGDEYFMNDEPIKKLEISKHSKHSKRLLEPMQEAVDYMCRYCSRTFQSPTGLKYHEGSAHEMYRYYCEAPGCMEVFTTKQIWSDHQWVHRDRMPYECVKFYPECSFKCRLHTSYRLHLLKVHQTIFCQAIHGYSETAQEVMARKALKKKPWDQKEHERKKMAGKTRFHLPYKCTQCDMAFLTDMRLRYHVRKIHTLQATFQCKFCPYNTTVKRIMFEHAFEHRDKYAWVCPHCDYKVNRQLKFKYHLKELHDVIYNDKVHGYSKEKIQQTVHENTCTEIQRRLADLSQTEVGENAASGSNELNENLSFL